MSNDCRVVTGTAIGWEVGIADRYVAVVGIRKSVCVAALQLAIDLRAQRRIAIKAIVVRLCAGRAPVFYLLVKSRRGRRYKRVNVVVCQKSAEARGRLQHETASRRRARPSRVVFVAKAL